MTISSTPFNNHSDKTDPNEKNSSINSTHGSKSTPTSKKTHWPIDFSQRFMDLSAFNAPTPTQANATQSSIESKKNNLKKKSQPLLDTDIAIIGIDLELPKCSSIFELKERLSNTTHCIEPIPNNRRDDTFIHTPDMVDAVKHYHSCSKVGGFIHHPFDFDNDYFSIDDTSAKLLSPEHRKLLESSVRSIQLAGHTPESFSSTHQHHVGVFMGITNNSYEWLYFDYAKHEFPLGPDSAPSIIPSAIAQRFNFHGPCLAIDTGCASGMSAIHHAAAAIITNECQACIVGSAYLPLHTRKFIGYTQSGMLSNHDAPMPFNQHANGFILSEGVGTIILKNAHQAILDNDPILGILAATTDTHQGDMSFSMKNPGIRNHQTIVGNIQRSLSKAQFNSNSIHYIEADATGIMYNDVSEFKAISSALNENKDCCIGAMESHFGHLIGVNGIAKIAKVLLQFHHHTLFPTINTDPINPLLKLKNIPINTSLTPWKRTHPRNALIHSFSGSGTLTNAIIKEYTPTPVANSHSNDPQIVCISAPTKKQLLQYCEQLNHAIQTPVFNNLPMSLTAIAMTLAIGRPNHRYRLAICCNTVQELCSHLNTIVNSDSINPSDHVHFGQALADLPEVIPMSHSHKEIAMAWVNGHTIDWNNYWKNHSSSIQRVPLPAVPFLGKCHTLTHSHKAKNKVTATKNQNSAPVSPKSDPPTTPNHINMNHQPTTHPSEILDSLMGIVTTITNNQLKISETTVISDCGINSIQLTQLTNTINQTFNISISPTIFFEEPTIQDLANTIESMIQTNPTPSDQSDHPIKSIVPSTRIDPKTMQNAKRIMATILSTDTIKESTPLHTLGFDAIAFNEWEHQWRQSSMAHYRAPKFNQTMSLNELLHLHPQQSMPHPATQQDDRQYPTSINTANTVSNECDVAIIGMAGRFPMCDSIDALWQALVNGSDCIQTAPDHYWNWESYQKTHPKFTPKWGGFVPNMDHFDAEFFKISPLEATHMDPQQRLFLEVSWEAIENAGIHPMDLYGSNTSVFVGIWNHEYLNVLENDPQRINENYKLLGNNHSICAGRLSHFLNLNGACEPIDTACSSSLVAIIRAATTIMQGQSTLAIAGGLNFCCDPKGMTGTLKSGMLSNDGRCKTFDASANGFTRSEGAAMLVLKSTQSAIADGDHIYGIIKGHHINHGGHAKTLTSPKASSQSKLYTAAAAMANVPFSHIDYIETHGTGTPLGDPIEIDGLKMACTEQSDTDILLGAIKTNIGHLETAAGVAGVIKVCLALKNNLIPKNIHCHNQNPYIDLKNSPFKLANQHHEWHKKTSNDGTIRPRMAGVSSFGFSGVNSHIILEEHLPSSMPPTNNIETELAFPISAPTKEKLSDLISKISHYVESLIQKNTTITARQIAHTLQRSRSQYKEKAVVIARYLGELHQHLQQLNLGNESIITKTATNQSLVNEAVEWVNNDTPTAWSNPINGTKTPIPSTPFHGKRYWVDPPSTELDPPEKPHISHEVPPKAINNMSHSPSSSPITPNHVAKQEDDSTQTEVLKKDILDTVIKKLTTLMKFEDNQLSADQLFESVGIDSLGLGDFTDQINDYYDIDLDPSVFFELTNCLQTADYLFEHYPNECATVHNHEISPTDSVSDPIEINPTNTIKDPSDNSQSNVNQTPNASEPVAVVGIGMVLPFADNWAQFCQALNENHITFIPYPAHRAQTPNDPLTQSKGLYFDRQPIIDQTVFNTSNDTAQLMSASQSLLTHSVWGSLEDAGIIPSSTHGQSCGVFIGMNRSEDHPIHNKLPEINPKTVDFATLFSPPANQISAEFDWHGPSETINTLSSSGAVAIAKAMQAIQRGDCAMAVAGAVNIVANGIGHQLLNAAGMTSQEKPCPFDDSANGYLTGEGACSIVLKPLHLAEKDGNSIYCVLAGAAVNHSGKGFQGMRTTAQGITRVIQKTYQSCHVDPNNVDYIECMGFGERMVDNFEFKGIQKAFKSLVSSDKRIPIGSIADQLSHAECLSGFLGLFHIIKAFQENNIPSIQSITTLNRYIKKQSPCFINQQSQEFESSTTPLTAGLQLSGAGGVNAHLIVQSCHIDEKPTHNEQPCVLISATSGNALKTYVERYIDWLNHPKNTHATLAAIGINSQYTRHAFNKRLAIIPSSKTELINSLTAYLNKETHPKVFTCDTLNTFQKQAKNDTEKNILAWLNGQEWDQLTPRSNQNFQRLHLPTYPLQHFQNKPPVFDQTFEKNLTHEMRNANKAIQPPSID